MPINPTWTRDELLLAYDLYLRHGKKDFGKRNPDVVSLSDYLRQLPWHNDQWRDPLFRNVGAVVMKIQQLRAYEEERLPASVSLPAKSIALEYRDHPGQVHALADAIRASVASQMEMLPDEVQEGLSPDAEQKVFREGRTNIATHRRLERNRQAVVMKLAEVKATTGKLACEVCEFEFEATYGELGRGFAECHHVVPLSEVGERDTRLGDLAVVCANCHRMLHRRTSEGVLLTVSELQVCLRSSLTAKG